MTKQILVMAQVISDEKALPKNVIFEAIEAALASATRKCHPEDIDARVEIDQESGDYKTFRCWTVLSLRDEEIEFNSLRHLTLAQAEEKDESLTLGDVYEEPIESIDLSGRIAAQVARQVLRQKVREAERNQVAEHYEGRLGELINGVVKRVTRENIVLDLGNNAEAIIPREEMLPKETARIGDRMRACLREIRRDARKGPQVIASRTCPRMLEELFRIEVPEIGEELLEVKAVARDPGSRAKLAVHTNDGRIDPIGACIGMRGARVQAVSNELGGERVDIVLWDDNPAQFVINAMAPAEVASIVVDEEKHSIDIAVLEDQLSQAIGRGGQNVNLATKLTGWTINVMTEADFENKGQAEAHNHVALFMETLNVEEDIATLLVEEGFATLEEIAYVPKQEMLVIAGFDEDIIEELRNRAKAALHEIAEKSKPADDLLNMEGMDEELAKRLALSGVKTREDLAEQSVDELVEEVGLEHEQSADLIMTARKIWFEE